MTEKRNRRRRWLALAPVLALAAAFALPSTAQTRRTLIDSGESPDLFLLYTGDVIGYLDPCG